MAAYPYPPQHYPKAPHDALGITTPPRLDEIFKGRQQLEDLCTELEVIEYRLEKLASLSFGCHLGMPEIRRTCRKVRQQIGQGMPFTVCNCPPTETDCPICKGKKWISATQYHLAPRPQLASPSLD